MNRRGRRVTIYAAALGTALVAVLALANWNMVRDHAEAWWFQFTTQTEDIPPGERLALGEHPLRTHIVTRWGLFDQLAAHSGIPVIVATRWRDASGREGWPFIWQPAHDPDPLAKLLMTLGSAGSRVIEQRYPRRAYVVVRPPVQSEREKRDLINQQRLAVSKVPLGTERP